jgi:hypothetical protein
MLSPDGGGDGLQRKPTVYQANLSCPFITNFAVFEVRKNKHMQIIVHRKEPETLCTKSRSFVVYLQVCLRGLYKPPRIVWASIQFDGNCPFLYGRVIQFIGAVFLQIALEVQNL